MNMSRKLGITVVAAALIAAYGCGKQEEPKKAEAPPRRRPLRSRKSSSSRSATEAR